MEYIPRLALPSPHRRETSTIYGIRVYVNPLFPGGPNSSPPSPPVPGVPGVVPSPALPPLPPAPIRPAWRRCRRPRRSLGVPALAAGTAVAYE